MLQRMNPVLGFVLSALLIVGLMGMVAEAAPSGKIVLYTSESLDQVNEMKADFEEVYPDIEIEIFRSGSGPVISKIQAEIQAGDLQADMIWLADIAFFNKLYRDGMLLTVDVPNAADLDPQFKYRGGAFWEVRQIFNVVAYNTRLVREAPTSWKDLLDPRLRNRTGMAGPLYSGAAFSTLGTLVNMPGFGWEFYEALRANGTHSGTGNGGVVQRLASGEFAMVSVVDFMVRNAKAQGSPVEHIWPEEGAILIPTPFAITSTSKNPEAAKAFLDYMLSERGQRLFVKQGYIPVKPGVGVPPGTPPLDQLKIAPTDQDFIEEHREELKERYVALFGE